ncbi:MAG: phosphomethylpyrimidine synthase ThiC [Candidatus Omnitrophota bacterium]
MTQLEYAKGKRITPLMKRLAAEENLPAKLIMQRIAEGKIVIPHNNTRRIKRPCAVGLGMRTKVNANLGTSTDKCDIKEELRKLFAAVKCGADTVMDLSVGRGLKETRCAILKNSAVPLGTVPVYQAAVRAKENKKNFLEFSAGDIMETLEEQAASGVDFFTIHAGVTRKSLKILKSQKRVLGIVSRGGAMLAGWMNLHKKENPFFEYFDKILDIAYKYDVTLSLGDGLRPGSILDATDKGQIAELKILGELALRARKKNVQVMIEGPGHVPLGQIKINIDLEKQLCHGAPFYVLGPLVCDVAAGYDHINAAIGAAVAGWQGADFLCYVTPAEHLRHPSIEDVREGVIAFKIAAHAADLAKKIPFAASWDKKMSLARSRRDWKKQILLSVNPEKAAKYRKSSRPHDSGVCTMCGDYCSIKLMDECLRE